MRISDWSSDVCSSDLPVDELLFCGNLGSGILFLTSRVRLLDPSGSFDTSSNHRLVDSQGGRAGQWVEIEVRGECRSEEHTSELQSLMRISYAVFCLKKKTK